MSVFLNRFPNNTYFSESFKVLNVFLVFQGFSRVFKWMLHFLWFRERCQEVLRGYSVFYGLWMYCMGFRTRSKTLNEVRSIQGIPRYYFPGYLAEILGVVREVLVIFSISRRCRPFETFQTWSQLFHEGFQGVLIFQDVPGMTEGVQVFSHASRTFKNIRTIVRSPRGG